MGSRGAKLVWDASIPLDSLQEVLEGSYEWMFEEEGRTRFSAPIEDKAFLEDRDNRRISFATGDSLRVKLAYKAVERGGKQSVENRVIEVLAKVEPAQQLTMPGGR